MKLVHDRVYVGTEVDCRQAEEGWAIIHACKSPCHQAAVGYKGNLVNSHPNYLILERDRDLYMNLIDPPVPLFMRESFDQYLRFAACHWQGGANLLIRCNKGESCATIVTTTSARSIFAMHSRSGGFPLASKYSCITTWNPAASAASRAAARYSFRSSTVEEMSTTGARLVSCFN